MLSVSFIIPSYLSGSTLYHTIDSIRKQAGVAKAEIIVVDSSNGSYLSDLESESTSAFPIKVIRSRERLYPGEARNMGIGYAVMQYIAFIDSDVVLLPDWAFTMATHYVRLKDHGEKVIVGGGLLNSPLSDNVWSNAMTILEFYHIYPNGRNEPRPFLPSANLFTEKSLLVENGLSFPAYRMAEDFLFCESVRRKDISLFFVGTHHVEHILRKSFFRYSYYLGAAASVCRLTVGPWHSRLLYAAILPIGSLYKLATVIRGILKGGRDYTYRSLKYLPLILLALPFIHWGMIHYPLRKSRWRKPRSHG
jgi:glycosyltransferase involved in cell wall biosynthesis